MEKPISLSSLFDRSVYSAHFMDPHLWEPYVRQVCGRHGFACDKVLPGVPGSFPTFIVETCVESTPHAEVVVKFFGPLFDGESSFNVERELGYWLQENTLPIPSPRVMAEGMLNEDWQYLVFEHVAGISIRQAQVELSGEEWQALAIQIGEYTRILHTWTPVEPGRASPICPILEPFTSFLQRQIVSCHANHWAWKDLPAHLLEQVDGYLLPVEELVDFSAPAHLIHADLTADHLLGSLVNQHWETRAVIDWGDAMCGNILYELVAITLDLFQSDKRLLQVFLEAYRLPEFYRAEFPRKAFSMLLLHQFPMPAEIYAPYASVASLDELAECLFAV